MRPIYILSVAQTPVNKETDLSNSPVGHDCRSRGYRRCRRRAGRGFMGNMLSGMLSQQQHLGALVADAAGLRGIRSSHGRGRMSAPAPRPCAGA